jgi:hypothetical protein
MYDPEIEKYIMTEKEVAQRTQIWEEINHDYLQLQKERELRKSDPNVKKPAVSSPFLSFCSCSNIDSLSLETKRPKEDKGGSATECSNCSRTSSGKENVEQNQL